MDSSRLRRWFASFFNVQTKKNPKSENINHVQGRQGQSPWRHAELGLKIHQRKLYCGQEGEKVSFDGRECNRQMGARLGE